jgi:hypothetical protein
VQDVIVGLLAVAVGALVCFRGYLAMRIIIPIWGAFAGFALGAGFIDNITGDGFLRSAMGWIVGLLVALAFWALAYLYYEVSVLIAMGAIGFALGSSLMVALGATWSWLIVLVGVLVGTLLAVVAIVGDFPTVLLTVLTALAGASTVVFGVMLLSGTLDTVEFESSAVTDHLADDWWWFALYIVLAVIGMVAQLRFVGRLRASLRDEWSSSGGKQLRGT